MRKTVVTVTLILAFLLPTTSVLAPTSAAANVEDSWTTLAQIPTGRMEFGVAVVSGKIYAIGGRNDWISRYLGTNEMYDPLTNDWFTKSPMPTPRKELSLGVFHNKIYAIGGIYGTDQRLDAPTITTGLNEVYDTAINTWESKSPMPTPRYGACVGEVNGKIYVIGGLQELDSYPNVGASPKNEVYNPETDTWSNKTSIPYPVWRASSAVLDGKIHVFGGIGDLFLSSYERSHQVYDPEKDTWTTASTLPFNVNRATAAATNGVFAPKRIYVFGGFISYEFSYASNLTLIYNPELDSWSNGTSMPTPRAALGAAVVNDELYVISGWQAMQPPSVENDKYTPLGYTTTPHDVPEFSSWIILLLSMTATSIVAATCFKKRKH